MEEVAVRIFGKQYQLRLTQHTRCGLTPLPFGTLPSVATSYILGTLDGNSELRGGKRK